MHFQHKSKESKSQLALIIPTQMSISKREVLRRTDPTPKTRPKCTIQPTSTAYASCTDRPNADKHQQKGTL